MVLVQELLSWSQLEEAGAGEAAAAAAAAAGSRPLNPNSLHRCLGVADAVAAAVTNPAAATVALKGAQVSYLFVPLQQQQQQQQQTIDWAAVSSINAGVKPFKDLLLGNSSSSSSSGNDISSSPVATLPSTTTVDQVMSARVSLLLIECCWQVTAALCTAVLL